MNFDRLIKAFLLSGLLCGVTNAATAAVNPADCKYFRLYDIGTIWNPMGSSLSYTDCGNRQHNLEAPWTMSPLAVKAGTVVQLSGNDGRASKTISVGNGMIIGCTFRPYDIVCQPPKPAPPNCKPIDVIYNEAHYLVNVYSTPCGGYGPSYVTISSGGMTIMAQENTEVLMGPQGTWTKDYLNYGKGPTTVGANGLNITCWGSEGGLHTGCKTY